MIEAFCADTKSSIFELSNYEPYAEKVVEIANRKFLLKGYNELTGSGYVIESMESALWCFMNSESFEEAILLAANIGNDADTTAAICGQIAGAYYGFSGIPERWSSAITKAKEIKRCANELASIGSETVKKIKERRK